MCNIPKLKSGLDEMSVRDMKRVLDEIAEWPTRYVSFVGGEALVRKEDVLQLIAYATLKGFHTTLFTGGGYLLSKKLCQDLAKAGLDRFTVSIDGANAETHDFIRGKWSFKRALKSFERMGKFEVKRDFATVILRWNFEELPAIYKLAKELGANQIFFQSVVLDNTYRAGQSAYDEAEFWISGSDIKKLKEVIKELIRLKFKDPHFTFNSLTYLRSIPAYFERKEKFNPGPCLAGYIGLNIDPYGNISICGVGPNLNVKGGKLADLWFSKEFKVARIAIKRCRIPCMMLCYGKFVACELLRYLLKGWS
jgi:MoaA/NifB/PqqE/SkfB family radical SAM enzyme